MPVLEPSYSKPTPGLCVGRHRHEPERPRKALEGVNWCGGCYDHAERLLSELPDLADDLERALMRSGASGPKISGNPEKALPYNERAGDTRRDLLQFVVTWSLLISEERGLGLPEDHTPAALTYWHRQQLPWIAAQPWADEYLTNLRQDTSAGRSVLAGQRTKRLPLGACPDPGACDVETHAELPCSGTITAVVDLTDDLLPARVSCDTCGHEHQARDLSALGKKLTGGKAWLTSPQAATTLQVTPGRLRGIAAEQGWDRRDPEGVRPVRWDADQVDAYRREQDAKRKAEAERKAAAASKRQGRMSA